MSHNQKKGIIIVAGGTGGHILPAIAVGEAIKHLSPNTKVMFVCGAKPLELEIYGRFGIRPIQLPVTPIYRQLKARLIGWTNLMRGFLQAVRILRRSAGVVLGMGGYVSAPVLSAARLLRIPFYLHEQNSIPGRTNQIFSKRARMVFCSFPMTVQRLPGVQAKVIGIPVRSSILKATREEALRFFDLTEGVPVLLILGGSQGARFINQIVLPLFKELDKLLRQINHRLQVIWSTGTAHFNFCTESLASFNFTQLEVKVFPFINRMEMAYAVADIALCRAGAATLAELALRSVPAFIIPLPHATDNHQYFNAEQFIKNGAGIIFEQHSLNTKRVAEEIVNLIKRPRQLQEMKQSAGSMAMPDAAEQIASYLIKEIQN